MVTASEALKRLQEGNARFVSDKRQPDPARYVHRRRELVGGQHPFAVILGCSDSRVPVEIVFDQGLGDLFVVRIAGNVAAPSPVSSIEFAVENFGSPLIVVLGHSECGAVTAALETGAAGSIVDQIQPALEDLDPSQTGAQRLRAAVRANVRHAVAQLQRSPVVGQLLASKKVSLTGAEYDLASGEVDFFVHV